MLSFLEYTLLIEGKADDFRRANPNLGFLSDAHAIRYGRALSRMEDLPSDSDKINQTLKHFDVHGSKLDMKLRDFNQHPSFEHVQTQLRPHVEKAESKKQRKSVASAGVDVVHDDGEGTVVKHIKTPEAAQGSECSGTDWCVSSGKIDDEGESVGARFFKTYADKGGTGEGGKARMFVINTPDRQKYAYHEGEKKLVRDKDDNGIPIHEFTQMYPSVRAATALHSTKHGIWFNPNPSSKELHKALETAKTSDDKLSVLQHSGIQAEHIDKALDDDDYSGVSLGAIQHPKATSENISKALKHKDWEVRQAAIRHPNATPEHIDKALDDENPDVREAAIQHPNASSENITKALNDVKYYAREAAILHPNATPEHIDKALDDENRYVRESAIRHHKATPENISKALSMTDEKYERVRKIAIQHPNVTPEHIDKALDDENPGIRLAAIQHPKATSEHISKALSMKGEEYKFVRAAAIKHPNATSEHISKALNDESYFVRRSIFDVQHPNVTPEHIDKALDDENPDVREEAIRHPKATSEHISKALSMKGEEYNFVRGEAIRHPNVKPEHIDKALDDESSGIREIARRRKREMEEK